MLKTLDIAITATRRPALLDLTLWSFQRNLLAHLGGTRVRILMNIDPIWGSSDDDSSLLAIAQRFCDQVVVNRPARPGFGTAVLWLWANTDSPWVLHLEDDWILTRRIDPSRVARELALPRAAQVRFNRKRNRLLRQSRFSLNPSLVNRTFIKEALADFDPRVDPEKQILRGHLRSLEQRWRYYTHGPAFAEPVAIDTGRYWRSAVNIEKSTENLTSTWTMGDLSRLDRIEFARQVATWRNMVEAADALPAI